MRTLFAAFAGLTLLTCTAAKAHVDITVDKNTQTMTVSVDGVERYRWPVSTGIPSYETPSGSYRTFRMEEDHFSKEFDDAPMPHSIFFTKIGHAIHGTDVENRLGTPASHGCVRLSKANASTLYALVQEQGVLNATVTLTGSSQVALARNPHRNTAVARRDTAQPDERQYYASREPVVLTPQPQYFAGRALPQQRPDDGYIYPADGSSNAQIYPAPRSSRPVYNAQQYYNNQGYPPAPQGYYYQPQQQYYQPRGFIQN
jgi:hypothetical protein